MKKSVLYKILAIGYFFVDSLFQVGWFCTSDFYWVMDAFMYNTPFMYGFAWCAFGESRTLAIIGFGLMLSLLIATLVFLISLFFRKKLFAIPLFLAVVNLVVHISLLVISPSPLWKEPFFYVGLLYKAVGCTLYALVVYNIRKMRKETLNNNQLSLAQSHQ